MEELDPPRVEDGTMGDTGTGPGILAPQGARNAECRVEGLGGGAVGWAVDWGAVAIAMVKHGVEGHSCEKHKQVKWTHSFTLGPSQRDFCLLRSKEAKLV